jgi:hypothetical protein
VTLLPAGARFGDLVYRRLRVRNAWNYKAPLLIACPYFMIAVGPVAWPPALLGIAAALCTIAGVAGVAYFLNDLTDIRADALAGKDNAVAAMSGGKRVFSLTLFLVLALAPWLYLPLTRAGVILLVAEFGLFAAYSFPPIRLKERGFLGVVADASYAHALPSVLALLTFAAMAPEPYARLTPLVVAIGAWQLAVGMRNIVLHQLADHGPDRVGGNQTLAITMGLDRLRSLLVRLLVPLEVVTFGGVVVVVFDRLPWLLPAYGAYAVLATWRLKILGQPYPTTSRDTLYTYADNFYADWLPLLILAFLLTQVPGCWPLAVLHMVIFRNGFRQTWHDVRGRWLTPSEAGSRS